MVVNRMNIRNTVRFRNSIYMTDEFTIGQERMFGAMVITLTLGKIATAGPW